MPKLTAVKRCATEFEKHGFDLTIDMGGKSYFFRAREWETFFRDRGFLTVVDTNGFVLGIFNEGNIVSVKCDVPSKPGFNATHKSDGFSNTPKSYVVKGTWKTKDGFVVYDETIDAFDNEDDAWKEAGEYWENYLNIVDGGFNAFEFLNPNDFARYNKMYGAQVFELFVDVIYR